MMILYSILPTVVIVIAMSFFHILDKLCTKLENSENSLPLEPHEWSRRSEIDPRGFLLQQRGCTPDHMWVLDLQTGEGIYIRPGGLDSADLIKKNVWVCPMYKFFLQWLYRQDLTDISKLPDKVDLGNVETAMSEPRRHGKEIFKEQAATYIAGLARNAGMTPFDYLESISKNKRDSQ